MNDAVPATLPLQTYIFLITNIPSIVADEPLILGITLLITGLLPNDPSKMTLTRHSSLIRRMVTCIIISTAINNTVFHQRTRAYDYDP